MGQSGIPEIRIKVVVLVVFEGSAMMMIPVSAKRMEGMDVCVGKLWGWERILLYRLSVVSCHVFPTAVARRQNDEDMIEGTPTTMDTLDEVEEERGGGGSPCGVCGVATYTSTS